MIGLALEALISVLAAPLKRKPRFEERVVTSLQAIAERPDPSDFLGRIQKLKDEHNCEGRQCLAVVMLGREWNAQTDYQELDLHTGIITERVLRMPD